MDVKSTVMPVVVTREEGRAVQCHHRVSCVVRSSGRSLMQKYINREKEEENEEITPADKQEKIKYRTRRQCPGSPRDGTLKSITVGTAHSDGHASCLIRTNWSWSSQVRRAAQLRSSCFDPCPGCPHCYALILKPLTRYSTGYWTFFSTQLLSRQLL